MRRVAQVCELGRIILARPEPGEVAALLAQLLELIGVCLVTAAQSAHDRESSSEQAPTIAPDAGRMLTAPEAGRIAGVSARWLYEHAHTLPFTRRLGPRMVRFSERALRQWLETRGR